MVQVFNGLALGVLLLVLSSGLAMIYGMRGVINFAHGALYMLGAYLALSISQAAGFWVALIVAPVALAAIGVLLDRYGLRLLENRDPLDLVLVTFGLTFVIQYVVESVWGTGARSPDAPALLDGTASFLGVSYPAYRLFLIGLGLAVGLALVLWLRRSRTGLYVRASGSDRVTAAVVGVDVDRVSATVVGLGAALAGLAGALAGPYLTLSPTMGIGILVSSFVTVVVGGVGSIGGAMLAALLIGLVQTVGVVIDPVVAQVAPYLVMLVVLLVRPLGFAGTRA